MRASQNFVPVSENLAVPSTAVYESETGNVRFVSEFSSGRHDLLVTFCPDKNLGKTVLFWEASNGT